MTDHVTVTVESGVVTILWHGSNTHIRIVRNSASSEAFAAMIADQLKRAFLEDHGSHTE